jgi:uncharacterized protein YceK
MRRLGILLSLAVAGVWALGGCGTICKLTEKDPDVYGGVQKDIEFAETPNALPLLSHWTPNSPEEALVLLLVPAEFCLSAVADTLTLPLVVWMRQN